MSVSMPVPTDGCIRLYVKEQGMPTLPTKFLVEVPKGTDAQTTLWTLREWMRDPLDDFQTVPEEAQYRANQTAALGAFESELFRLDPTGTRTV
jgi:hypothetical protein